MNISDIKSFFKHHMYEYSSIRGKMLSVSKDKEIKTILVTSCYPGEGKTTAALSMAYSLTEEASYKVMLIDGNFRAPVLHDYFKVSLSPGFSDIFFSQSKHYLSFKANDNKSLVVIPNGTEISNPSTLLSSESLKEKLHAIGQGVHYVIVDGASLFGISDVLVSAKYFDGIIIVVESAKTRWEVVREARERLESVGGYILGVVLNKRNYYIPKAIYGKV